MDRLTKAAVATAGAALLLLGGGYTLAYWTAEGTIAGGDLSSGSLAIDGPGDCGAGWTYVDGGGAVSLIVPGDVVETECTLTVTGTGDHIGIGQIVVSNPSFTNQSGDTGDFGTQDLTTTISGLTVGATVVTVAGDGTLTPPQPIAGTLDLTVTVQVSFEYGDDTTISQNTSQLATAALDDITVTVTQADPADL